jgi:hypothetical protein
MTLADDNRQGGVDVSAEAFSWPIVVAEDGPQFPFPGWHITCPQYGNDYIRASSWNYDQDGWKRGDFQVVVPKEMYDRPDPRSSRWREVKEIMETGRLSRARD